ncbi:MAG: peptidoglycan editing factor PgeF [Proteobacteria bacterium]|nr:peptidoglycan editing factor PgeF [Desulfocapsa sp.]MBU3945231.1 peptidoglycan editing factor PgeF [Pseudomonadota bacterium]MCG2742444.1 peptidoglycan editing factor PgeF [Desulfobacteraceae bacterium]MBU4084376.1 peptidoglycan editing factor PgeF [Pseudomonadota bacterium]MBU4109335.1 peptidoglycan editing factor PgeF [Pseudomonadota bacterium]
MLTPCPFITAAAPDLIMATFNRHHGVSEAPFFSLNGSFGVGDCAENVQVNRNRMKQSLGINRLVSARQVHGEQIFRVEEMPDSDQEIDGIDALMTNKRGVGLMIQHADCQAVLLHDPVQSAIAAVHCGWRGSVIGIINKTVQTMRSCYQSDPEDIVASISPSLGPCCAEFINHRQELPASFQAFQTRSNYFDFWQISRSQLMEAGLQLDNIQIAGICTACSQDFFSYRRAKRKEKGITGRNCSIISLTTTTSHTMVQKIDLQE